MDELKNWMFEKIEVNVAGNVPQNTSPELSQIDTDIFSEFNQFDDAVPYNHPLSGSQDSASSYDWNNTQYGTDLVSESFQFINSAGSVMDQTFILTSHHQPQGYIAAYPH
jgi:regulatory protein YycH of two-component signal transduction system YycFG